jgi:hypothetical protein
MVRAIMIVEVAGRPPEHLKSALSEHIGVLNKVNDITVHSIKLSEPREIENSKGMFTCFAEADFECDSFARLSETMFDFMPSSVEIIEPSKVSLNMNEATNLLNNISGRMHRYDELAKIAGIKLKQMAKREAELLAEIEKGKKVVKKKVKKSKKDTKKKVKKKK